MKIISNAGYNRCRHHPGRCLLPFSKSVRAGNPSWCVLCNHNASSDGTGTILIAALVSLACKALLWMNLAHVLHGGKLLKEPELNDKE